MENLRILPAPGTGPAGPRATSPAMPPGAAALRSRVLIVDDDIAVRLRVRDLLELADGHEVFEACDGPAGLTAARDCAPDLILLDIMMPGMDGLEVCQRLRADPKTREIPVLILSGADESQALLAALEAGAEDFLPKPFAPEELRAKARNITRLNRFRALSQERRRLRWIVDQSAEALITVDGRGGLLTANTRARDLFGLVDSTSTDVFAALSRHFRPEPADALERLRAGTWPDATPFTLGRPASQLVEALWLQVDVFADPDDGSGSRLLKFSDRSEQVRGSLETRGFQHVVSHKLRTPLNGLGGMLDMLSETGAVTRDPECAELLRLARESATRLEQTVDGILKYSAALFTPARRLPCTTASETVRDLLRAVAGDADLAPATLRLTGASESRIPPETVAPLRNACMEILDNYRKFSDAPRTGLEVSVSLLADSSLRLRFFATGPALPPDALAALGRPYWQLEGRFTGEVPGIGLGIATARLLLRALGGDLRFLPGVDPAGVITEMDLPPQAHVPGPA